MRVEGEIENGLGHDVYLHYQSWEAGKFAEEDLVVSAGGHVGFNLLADPRAGEIYYETKRAASTNGSSALYSMRADLLRFKWKESK